VSGCSILLMKKRFAMSYVAISPMLTKAARCIQEREHGREKSEEMPEMSAQSTPLGTEGSPVRWGRSPCKDPARPPVSQCYQTRERDSESVGSRRCERKWDGEF
jgi:hypothetical protein